jgi:subtilisin family serine protease
MQCLVTTLALLVFGGSAVAAPAFQIREADPDRTARTLDLVQDPTRFPEEGKVWVYFTDKAVFDSESTAAHLAGAKALLGDHAARRRAKVLGRDLVDFHDLPVAEHYVARLEELGADVRRTSRWLNAVSIKASTAALHTIAGEPFVAWLDPVRAFERVGAVRASTPPSVSLERRGDDPFDYGASRDQLEQIGVIDAHVAGYSGDGVVIALMDTGFNTDHPTFADLITDGRLLAQWDFVDDDGVVQNEGPGDDGQHDHGTFTWSAAGGFTPGELVGPAHGASFLLAKTEDISSETPVEEDNWVAAAEWADLNGADVISTSLGYLDWYTYEDLDGDTGTMTNACDLAASRGIVVVTSAGNQGDDDWFYITVPADADSILSVGAVDVDNDLAGFSSHGPTFDGRTKPEVVARGVETYCAIPADLGAEYWWLSGTSLSCPLVAGATALVVEAHPDWTPMQVREALLATADNATSPDNDRGWGLIDVMAAIDTILDIDAPGISPSASAVPRVTVIPNPFRARTRIGYSLPTGIASPATLEVYGPDGALVRAYILSSGSAGLTWDGRDTSGHRVGAGVYLARLQAGPWRATTKVVMQP